MGPTQTRRELEMAVNEMWNVLVDMGVSEQALDLITDINGYNEQTMCDILYAYAGYNDFDQLN